MKRELEEVKNQPRGLEGTFRTAAEMERHRAQLADAAIEEQLEVQTAFREHGARLQVCVPRSLVASYVSCVAALLVVLICWVPCHVGVSGVDSQGSALRQLLFAFQSLAAQPVSDKTCLCCKQFVWWVLPEEDAGMQLLVLTYSHPMVTQLPHFALPR